MPITFADEFHYEINPRRVEFYADAAGDAPRIACWVTCAALVDHLNPDHLEDTGENALTLFSQSRARIHGMALRKIHAGDLNAAGDVVITSGDF